MGVADALTVFRLEFRRYLRWRPLRRWLLSWTLLGVLLAIGIVALVAQGEAFWSLGAWGRMLLGVLYVLPTWVGFSSAILLTQRIAWDATRRGELHDLYLTALSPFAIALGKVAACWALTGVLMAAAAPALTAWVHTPLWWWGFVPPLGIVSGLAVEFHPLWTLSHIVGMLLYAGLGAAACLRLLRGVWRSQEGAFDAEREGWE